MTRPALIEKPEPLYPGAAILLTRFSREDEFGDVRVQDYSEMNKTASAFRVGQFLPGIVECPPGDTPKVWPEVHQYVATFDEAYEVFVRYVEAAKSAGWNQIEDDPRRS